MRVPRVDYTHALGLLDKLVGLGKEAVGEVIENRDLVKAGEAQQEKGTQRLKALRKQAEADAHEAKAEAHEQKEKSAQRAKEKAS